MSSINDWYSAKTGGMSGYQPPQHPSYPPSPKPSYREEPSRLAMEWRNDEMAERLYKRNKWFRYAVVILLSLNLLLTGYVIYKGSPTAAMAGISGGFQGLVSDMRQTFYNKPLQPGERRMYRVIYDGKVLDEKVYD